jgi:hypothetical protein
MKYVHYALLQMICTSHWRVEQLLALPLPPCRLKWFATTVMEFARDWIWSVHASVSNNVSRQRRRSQIQVDVEMADRSVTSNGPTTLTSAPPVDIAVTLVLFCVFPVFCSFVL